MQSTPLPGAKECHLEFLDDSPLLQLDGHRTFQMLLGMLQWLVQIGRLELSAEVSSLNCFGACLCVTHLFAFLGSIMILSAVLISKSSPLIGVRCSSRSSTTLNFLNSSLIFFWTTTQPDADPKFPHLSVCSQDNDTRLSSFRTCTR